MSCLVAALLILAAGSYCRWIGLPDWTWHSVRKRLLDQGIILDTDRIQWVRASTLRARGVQLTHVSELQRYAVSIAEAELDFTWDGWRAWQIRPESLHISDGRGRWSAFKADGSKSDLILDKVRSTARWTRGQTWQIDYLESEWSGLQVRISGSLAHPEELKTWFRRPSEIKTKPRPARPSEWLDNLSGFRFSPETVLSIHLDADGREPGRTQGVFELISPKAQTPWGELADASMVLKALPDPANAPTTAIEVNARWNEASNVHGQIHRFGFESRSRFSLPHRQLQDAVWKLACQGVESQWGKANALELTGTAQRTKSKEAPLQTEIHLRGQNLHSVWFETSEAVLTAQLSHSSTNWLTVHGGWKLSTPMALSRWGECSSLEMTGQIAPAPFREESSGSGLWRILSPLNLACQAKVQGARFRQVEVEQATIDAQWQSPRFALNQFHAQLYGGRLEASASMDVIRRRMEAEFAFDFDLHGIRPLLTTNAQRWLQQYSWDKPPEVRGAASCILPPWSEKKPRWREDVLPTLTLAGSFRGTQGAFRSAPVDSASGTFSLTNLVWRLPDLWVARSDGSALLDYTGHMFTRDYHWRVDSRLNPHALRPLFEAREQRVLDDFQFAEPPHVQAEIWGRWRDRERMGLAGAVTATNFVFRGESFHELSGQAAFTNRIWHFENAFLRNGRERITAPSLAFDSDSRLLHVTNALSTMDPGRITKIIGPKTHAALRPYVFGTPPTVRIQGQLPASRSGRADARFEVQGSDFTCWKFAASDISGSIAWTGDVVSFSNVRASLYNGLLDWRGQFDFTGHDGAQFQFHGAIQNTDLSQWMAGFSPKPSRLEGLLNGELTITNAHTKSWQSWQGHGHLALQDGFLWNIPVFGFLSPVLNRVAPGIGESRVSAGSATFAVDRGVIRTSDLEVRSPALRLQYAGQVGFDGHVNARMRAEILRDAWAVGRAVSLALWPLSKVFEYRIFGTVNEPKSELVYFPKVLMWPFHPVKAMRDVLSLPLPLLGPDPRKVDASDEPPETKP